MARQESKSDSFAQPIRIESDCWIGARVTILPGVRIGRGSTIAAGAVVIKDIEEDCMAGGVPAKVIRKLKGALNGVPKGPLNGK
jgi:maltose O-acetyltransferase